MTMTLEKAYQIIGIAENASREEVIIIVNRRIISAKKDLQEASPENKEAEKKKIPREVRG